MHRSAVAFLSLFVGVILWCSPAMTQTTSGRWTIGISGGLNIWKNDVYDLTPSPGVIVDAQYGFSSVFSAGISVGFESLKSKSSDLRPGEPFPYMKMHMIPATLDFRVNLLPGEIIAPFLAFGGGVIAYL